MATWIVGRYKEFEFQHGVDANGKAIMVNPVGYQHVLYATIVLYIIALIICLVMVKPTDKAIEAKNAKKAKKEAKA